VVVGSDDSALRSEGVSYGLSNGENVPNLIFRHVDDAVGQEVRVQLHDGRRVAVRCHFLEWSPTRTFIYTEYDPGLVLEAHGHCSDHIIYILKGSVRIGDVECRPGMMILLEHQAVFGPIVAGPEGTELLEFYTGDASPVSVDPTGYELLLAERGITPMPHPPFDPTLAGGSLDGCVYKMRTNLEVRDVAASIAFYRRVLGLEARTTMGDPPIFALLANGGGSLGLAEATAPAVGSIVTCYVDVPDVEAAFERCTAAGATITTPLTTHPWRMRDFVFRDLDGHQIAVGEQVG
jgi:predicted enzyme related to lactoylglutathione lyase